MPPQQNLPLVTRDAVEGQKTAEMAAMQRMAGNLRILAESIKPGSTANKEITFDELGRIAVEQRQLQEFFEKHLKTLVRGILGTGELNPTKALEKVRRLQALEETGPGPIAPDKDQTAAEAFGGSNVELENARRALEILEKEIEDVLNDLPEKFRIKVRAGGGLLENYGASLAASVAELLKATNASERGEELLTRTRKLSEMVQVACVPGNAEYSPYLFGMANMGIFALSVLTNVEPAYLDQPKKWREKDPLGMTPPVEAMISSGEKGSPS